MPDDNARFLWDFLEEKLFLPWELLFFYGIILIFFKGEHITSKWDTLQTKVVTYFFGNGRLFGIYIYFFTKMYLRRVQNCHLGTGIIICHSLSIHCILRKGALYLHYILCIIFSKINAKEKLEERKIRITRSTCPRLCCVPSFDHWFD